MSPRTRNRLQRVLTAVTVALPLLAAWRCLDLLCPESPWQPPPIETAAPLSQPRADTAPDSALFAVIWERNIRQRLFDPPPQSVQARKSNEHKLSFQLIGTAIEPDACYGLFRLADSRTEVKPIGAEIEGFEIVSITRGCVRLRNGPQEYELQVPWFERLKVREEAVDAP